jgi:hypothetical protein
MIVGIESGVHNQNLANSQKRIIEGGSWKQQRVVMIIPAAKTIPTKVYLSHCSLMFPPNNGSFKMAAIGLEVGEAFSSAIEQVLAHPDLSQWEYILTIEHDNIPPPDGLLRLIQAMENNKHLSCVGGLYWTKGEGGVPQIWGDAKDPNINFRPQPPDINGGLVECCGTGMGFNLWRISMFKDPKLRKPWFKTLTGIEGQGIGTQDLYFWGDARKHGYRCAIDCSVKVGHYDLNSDITW